MPTDDGHKSDQEADSSNDWLLENLIRELNEIDSGSIGITVSINGAIVTGNLVSGKKFLEEYGAQLATAYGRKEDSKAVLTHYRKLAAEAYDPPKSEERKRQPGYIHFTDATILIGPVRYVVNVWRAKFCEVDGFTLGRMSN